MRGSVEKELMSTGQKSSSTFQWGDAHSSFTGSFRAFHFHARFRDRFDPA
jgi:hypothetical protein